MGDANSKQHTLSTRKCSMRHLGLIICIALCMSCSPGDEASVDAKQKESAQQAPQTEETAEVETNDEEQRRRWRRPGQPEIIVGDRIAVNRLAYAMQFPLIGPTLGLPLTTNDPPTQVLAETLQDGDGSGDEQAKVLLVSDKFQNTQGDQSSPYDITVYIIVAEGDKDYIKERIEKRNLRITEALIRIVASLPQEDLEDPDRAVLKQILQGMCLEQFGRRKDGEPYVRDVLCSRWIRFYVDLR